MKSWRTQVYYAGGLRGDGSPESEPGRRVSQGFYGLRLPGPCLASWTGVTSGKVVDAETNLQKQMCGGGVVGAVGWTLLSHQGRGLSFLPFFFFFFLSFLFFVVFVVVVAISWAAPAAYGGSQARG